MITREVMDDLRMMEGRRANIVFVLSGIVVDEEVIIDKVKDFEYVAIRGEEDSTVLKVHFIDYSCAIQEVSKLDGEVVFYNPMITEDYDLTEENDINIIRFISFGGRIALMLHLRDDE